MNNIQTQSILTVPNQLLSLLHNDNPIISNQLSFVMNAEFGGTDAQGLWNWRLAYDLLEAALVLWVREAPTVNLKTLTELMAKLPTQSRRSLEQVELQQFSTPLPMAELVAKAAAVTEQDTVLEPSAGNGLLATFSDRLGASLILNEIAPQRKAILSALFPNSPVFDYDAENIDDFLESEHRPSVILMNPPFSASPKMLKRNQGATAQHLYSALRRLLPGGRLVAITAEGFSFSEAMRTRRWDSRNRVLFSVGISGKEYYKHGTSIKTRLTVIEKGGESVEPQILGIRPLVQISQLLEQLPPRQEIIIGQRTYFTPTPTKRVRQPQTSRYVPDNDFGQIIELSYRPRENYESTVDEGIFSQYQLQAITIDGASPHPSPLVESAAMASVKPPVPTYKPLLPQRLISEGLLSEAQLETVIYAGNAHSQILEGYYRLDDHDDLVVCNQENEGANQYRKGYFIGNATGTGKGREVSGVLLDQWLQGNTKAVWISKSASLLEDAKRDWTALGGKPEQIIPLSAFKQGEVINITTGIIFATYATLRTTAKLGKCSRVEQLVNWLGEEFSGVICFDESHAMGNCTTTRNSFGLKNASQQGLAGLELQRKLPLARVLYVSATGATVVDNLAYAERLGLWIGNELPFLSREEFLNQMHQGGIAALEVVCRDLKALGVYCSRSLSYQGVEYQILEHQVTQQQVEIYDTYAQAFQVIYQNLESALRAARANHKSRSVAKSVFWNNNQRFFNHLITAIKCPTLIRAIVADLEAGHCAVIQLVSTGEALLTRKLAQIPTEEWDDLQIDLTPKEAIFEYLVSAFPTQLHETYTDSKGKQRTRPVFDEQGEPVQSTEALELREQLIESLALLPPVPTALDKLIWHFGTDQVAEITGRTKRVVRVQDKYKLESRSPMANLAETDNFQSNRKRILIFSLAGGTGRSYHADANALNQRLRKHYLLEAGWQASEALQGLGRTHRSNQTQPPVFCPVTTNIKGEKRFIASIARRLDSLGALTKGQRQAGTQNIYRPEDNLESSYANAALRDLFESLAHNFVPNCDLEQFEHLTGLVLLNEAGSLKAELPSLKQFLNRLLGLPIAQQNRFFEAFEVRLVSRIEGAIEAGTYERGVEMLTGDFRILTQQPLSQHPNGSQTTCYQIERRDPTPRLSVDEALELASNGGQLVINQRSNNVAIANPTSSLFNSDGSSTARIQLTFPDGQTQKLSQAYYQNHSTWRFVTFEHWQGRWESALSEIPTHQYSTFYLVTGLLLPIWDRLGDERIKVYRLITQCGQTLLGRVIFASEINEVYRNFEVNSNEQLTPEQVYKNVAEEGRVIDVNPWQLKRSRVAGNYRLEIFPVHSRTEVEYLRNLGAFSEIINYQLRVFLPNQSELATRIIEQSI
ncbi:strawberry notch family protein [Crocosphaera sp. UHCC 0190]|uniref:strawberry notch-like NTP hydrolase domain-containing protein n=1 Tax=Crocosphaera sp. UHCC 0190 TaxID=3110246 RepID=UPI002B1EA5DF|nr:strawberry notch family protein [Crocosphaera sp. UHCC 0190]MEA5512267.1 strawberry notch family protein [Crocosphaera sp. UHCC 0190]